MSDWQVGDLALCIKQGPWVRTFSSGRRVDSAGPKAGALLSVRQVRPGITSTIALLFSDYPDPSDPRSRGYNSTRFRKIRPHTPDAEDRNHRPAERRSGASS